MQLQFPRHHWKQRYKYTLEELIYISDRSRSITLNMDKWKANSYQYVKYAYIDAERTRIVDSLVTGNEPRDIYNALNEACDTSCIICSHTPDEYEDMYAIQLDKDHERVEVLCKDCRNKVYTPKRDNEATITIDIIREIQRRVL